MTGSRSEIVYEALPDGRSRRCASPTSRRARELLGWEPQVALRDGLQRTIDAGGRRGARSALGRLEAHLPALARRFSSCVSDGQPATARADAPDVESDAAGRAAARRRGRCPTLPVGELEHDVRRRRPPALSFLLRMDTLRRLARVVLAAGARLARRLRGDPRRARAEVGAARRRVDSPSTRRRPTTTRPSPSSSRRCCSRAPGSTPTAPRARACAPSSRRCSGSRSSRCSTRRSTARSSRATTSSGARWSSAIVIVSALRWGYERRQRRAAARRRLPPPRGARRHGPAHRGGRARARATPGSVSPIDVVGFISLTPRPDNGLRSLGQLERPARDHRARARIDEVIIADPDFPQQRGGRARRPVPPARRARADRAVDDGDPRPPRRVRPGRGGAAVRAALAGLRGLRLRSSSARSTSSARSLLLIAAEPAAAR